MKLNPKKTITMLSLGILAYVVLKVMLLLDQRYFIIFYELFAGIPIIVYVCIVRGRTGVLPKREQLPDEWTDDEKTLFLSQETERRKRGKICLYIAFPFIIALIVALLTEYYIPVIFG